MPRRNVYTAFDLDRCDARRGDEGWISERLADPATRLVVVWRGQCLAAASETPAAFFCDPTVFADRVEAEDFTLLGVADGETYFAVDLSHEESPLDHLDLGDAVCFEDLRRIGPYLPHREGALLAYARAMAHWHDRHRFCGACGGPTRRARAGHVRRCENPECGAEHFPRTDPAVIMLVTHEDAVLLARQSHWRPHGYSILAGFVEPGEDLEHAVVREVLEEAGVEVADVRYHSSQPWPFPASLMIGFTARALSRELSLKESELEEARWMTREEVLQAVTRGEVSLSPSDSISRRLLDEWIEGEL